MSGQAKLPLVSICIANYNGESLLRDCIGSIFEQEADFEIEVLVHDDASGDGSIALLESGYPDIRIIRSATNVGFCISNNRMVEAARGDFILLLNNDTALYPDAISTLVEQWKLTPSSILTLPQYAWDDGRLINRGCRLDIFYNVVPVLDDGEAPIAMVEAACLFMEKNLWERLGGFPESFGSIAEDALLCCAARLSGAQIICARSSGYRHRQGASFGGNRILSTTLASPYSRRYLSERNRFALLLGCTPTRLTWMLLLLHLLQLLTEAALVCALSRSAEAWRRIYLPAIGDAWKQRDSTRRLRQRLQALRTIGLGDYFKAFTFIPQRLRLLTRHGIPTLSD